MNEADKERLRTVRRQRYQPFYDPRDHKYYYGEEAAKRRDEYHELQSAKTAKTRARITLATFTIVVITMLFGILIGLLLFATRKS